MLACHDTLLCIAEATRTKPAGWCGVHLFHFSLSRNEPSVGLYLGLASRKPPLLLLRSLTLSKLPSEKNNQLTKTPDLLNLQTNYPLTLRKTDNLPLKVEGMIGTMKLISYV